MKKPAKASFAEAKASPVEVAKAAVKRVIRVRPKPAAPADAPRRPEESRF